MSYPFHPNINVHVLQIVPYTFPEVLTRRLKTKSFF